ncbi:MAG: hypothetical protein AAF618_01675 [Pseudomonadota bacterium]
MARWICLMLAVSMLSGCSGFSESRFNPMNLLGGGGAEEEEGAPREVRQENVRPLVPQERVVQTVDTRPLVAQITALEVTPASGGVIVRANGRAAQAGTYSAELTLAAATPTSLTFDMRAFQGAGSGDGRVGVARFVSNEELGSARSITVRANGNTLTRSR